MNWITRFMKYVVTWRKHRRVIKQLNEMSNRELADIGINRGDIDRLVWLKEDKDKSGN